MSFLCANCHTALVTAPYRNGAERYCSIGCYTQHPSQSGFCTCCTSITDDEGPDDLGTSGSTGVQLRPAGARCPDCHSVLAHRTVVVLGIPVHQRESYRAKWLSSPRHSQYGTSIFIARRIKSSESTSHPQRPTKSRRSNHFVVFATAFAWALVLFMFVTVKYKHETFDPERTYRITTSQNRGYTNDEHLEFGAALIAKQDALNFQKRIGRLCALGAGILGTVVIIHRICVGELDPADIPTYIFSR